MTQPRRGRPPHAGPDASHAARLGAEIRARRQRQGLTLEALAKLIGFSPQHLSEVELAKAPVSGPFVAACDRALHAQGKLSALLPAVVCERAVQRHDRGIARRLSGDEVPVDAGWQVPAAIDLAGSQAAQPVASASVDPELVPHWLELKGVLTDHDQMFGPHRVLAMAKRGLGIIGRHRQAARGHLRIDLMRVEARWEMLVACAAAGEPDRAAHEGLRALKVARATRSERAIQELRRLDHRLAASPRAEGAAEFREAFAAAR